MTNTEFKYWLQGFFALDESTVKLTPRQLAIIESHLNLVLAIDGSLSIQNQRIKDLLDNLKKSKNRSVESLRKIHDDIFDVVTV